MLFAGAGAALALEWPLRKVFTPKVGGEAGRAEAKSAAGSRAVVFGLQAGSIGSISRLEVTATRPLRPRIFLLAEPRRAIVDLPETVFQMNSPAKAKQRPASATGRLVGAYRYGLLAPGRSRVVVDLGGPAKIVKVSTVRIAESVHRLRIDFAKSTLADFRAAAARGLRTAAVQAVETAQGAGKIAGDQALPLVAIDPGHGGIDGGAQAANGASEKDIVFAFSLELAAQLRKTGRYRVLMTRESDVFVPLRQRVEMARKAKAQLLISIHADSLSQARVTGATVYTVSERASDADAARLAEKENRADERAGYVAQQAEAEVSDILFDLTRRETRAFSHVFAHSLVAHLRKTANMNSNPHRAGGFAVLKAVDVPSVLLELGFLSNQADAKRMADPEWRAKSAASATKAVAAFFASQAKKARLAKAGPGAAVAASGKTSGGD